MILHWLRRSRLLAGLLLAASPAVGGTVLPAIHPCPVDAPWLAAKHQAAVAGHHMGHTAPTSTHQHEFCNCVGGCVAAPAVAPPSVATIAVPAPGRPVTAFWISEDASLDLPPLATLLPPAIAPPLV